MFNLTKNLRMTLLVISTFNRIMIHAHLFFWNLDIFKLFYLHLQIRIYTRNKLLSDDSSKILQRVMLFIDFSLLLAMSGQIPQHFTLSPNASSKQERFL